MQGWTKFSEDTGGKGGTVLALKDPPVFVEKEMRHEQGQSPRLNCLDQMQGWLPAHPIWNPCCWDDWSRLAGVSTWSKLG